MVRIEPVIRELPEKRLLGAQLEMSVAANQTALLWESFMSRKSEITSVASKDFWSVQVYPPNYFEQYDPAATFFKWAAVEVDAVDAIPEGMELLEIPAGLYAVFHYQGLATDPEIFRYIFAEWVPGSGYFLDDRPHFEIMGDKFRRNDPTSEEEIWIPIKI